MSNSVFMNIITIFLNYIYWTLTAFEVIYSLWILPTYCISGVWTDPVERSYTGKSISLGSQPKMIAPLEDGIIAVTTQEVGVNIYKVKDLGVILPHHFHPFFVSVFSFMRWILGFELRLHLLPRYSKRWLNGGGVGQDVLLIHCLWWPLMT